LTGVALAVVPAGSALAGSCATVTVPAYFTAGPSWVTATVGYGPVHRTLILNPASGPGVAQDLSYVAAVNNARATGAGVVGYVHTSYGARPAADVLAEVALYQQLYGITGIFFDEVSSGSGYLAYYRAFSTQVRAAGGLVILNPGVYPDRGYMALADQVVTFEGVYDDYRRARVPNWIGSYPPSQFTHLVYATNQRNLASALSLADQRRAGNVYVTNDGGANPWDTLPSYWSSELASIQTRCLS
jgi:hypothetical protein